MRDALHRAHHFRFHDPLLLRLGLHLGLRLGLRLGLLDSLLDSLLLGHLLHCLLFLLCGVLRCCVCLCQRFLWCESFLGNSFLEETIHGVALRTRLEPCAFFFFHRHLRLLLRDLTRHIFRLGPWRGGGRGCCGILRRLLLRLLFQETFRGFQLLHHRFDLLLLLLVSRQFILQSCTHSLLGSLHSLLGCHPPLPLEICSSLLDDGMGTICPHDMSFLRCESLRHESFTHEARIGANLHPSLFRLRSFNRCFMVRLFRNLASHFFLVMQIPLVACSFLSSCSARSARCDLCRSVATSG